MRLSHSSPMEFDTRFSPYEEEVHDGEKLISDFRARVSTAQLIDRKLQHLLHQREPNTPDWPTEFDKSGLCGN